MNRTATGRTEPRKPVERGFPLTNGEIATVALLFAAATLLLALYSFDLSLSKHLDSTFLFEALDNIRSTGIPMSGTVDSLAQIFALLDTPPEIYCASPFAPPSHPYNVLHNHAYFALYLLALPTYVMSPEASLALVNALTHMVLLFLPYVYLRWSGVSRLASVVFVGCVAVYPGWSYSSLGDYYLDRIYMMFMAPLLFGVHVLARSERVPRTAIVIGAACAACAALCTERGAIMVIGLLCFYLFFYRAELKGKGVLSPIAAAIALLVIYLSIYSFVIFKGIGEGAGGLLSQRIGFGELWGRISSPPGRIFLLVNLLPLGVLALFSGSRYVLLLVGALLPNVLFTAGGAELDAWYTHYHSMYVPFLIFTACVGYERIIHWAAGRKAMAAAAPLAIAAATFMVALLLDPSAGLGSGTKLSSITNGVFGSAWRYYLEPQQSYERSLVETYRSVAAIVPAGTSASVGEPAMPALYAGRRLFYFPLGMDTVEYLVVSGTAGGGKLTAVEGLITYLGKGEEAAISQCLLQRINALDFAVVKDFPGTHVVVMKRTR